MNSAVLVGLTNTRATISLRSMTAGGLVALECEVVEATLVLDVLPEGVDQAAEGTPGLGMVRLEHHEAGGFRDGFLHVHHQTAHVDAVHGRGLALQRLLAPDVDAGVGEHGDDIDPFRIEHIALATAGLVGQGERVEDAATVDTGGRVPDVGLLVAAGDAARHRAAGRHQLLARVDRIADLQPGVVERRIGGVEGRVAVHPLSLAEVDRFERLQVHGRVGDEQQILAPLGIGDSGVDDRHRGDAGDHQQVQGVDLVKAIEAGMLRGIADEVRIGQIGQTIVAAAEREHAQCRTVAGRSRHGCQILDQDEIRAVVDRQLHMVRQRLVHAQILEHLDHIAFVPDHQVEMVGRIERTVLDGDGESVAPDAFVHGLDPQGVGGRRLPVLQHDGRFERRQGVPVGGVGEMGDAGDVEDRPAVVEKRPCGVGQIALVDIGAETVDELFPARHQHGLVDRAFLGHPDHGGRRGRDLLHIETEVRFPGVNPGR